MAKKARPSRKGRGGKRHTALVAWVEEGDLFNKIGSGNNRKKKNHGPTRRT